MPGCLDDLVVFFQNRAILPPDLQGRAGDGTYGPYVDPT
jgi:hypothetical protein